MAMNSIDANATYLPATHIVQNAQFHQQLSSQDQKRQQRETVTTVEAERFDPQKKFGTTEEMFSAYASAQKQLGISGDKPAGGRSAAASAYTQTANQQVRDAMQDTLGISVYA